MTNSPSTTIPDTAAAHNTLTGLALGLIGVLFFAGTLPATRIAVQTFDAGFLTFGRAFLAALAAAVCLLLMKRRFPRKHLWPLLFAGTALVYGFPGFMTLAMTTLPASHGGVVLGILPLGTAIFATLFAGEKPSPLFWLCGVIGAALVIVFSLRDSHWSFEAGDLWLLIAAIIASSGYVVSGKLSNHMPGWEVISWALVLLSPISALGMALFWQQPYLDAPHPQLWAFAYVSFGSMFLGFFFWNAGLQKGGIARVGQLQLLQPFFTLAIAAALLGEVVTVETLVFAIAVLAVVLAGRKTRVAK